MNDFQNVINTQDGGTTVFVINLTVNGNGNVLTIGTINPPTVISRHGKANEKKKKPLLTQIVEFLDSIHLAVWLRSMSFLVFSHYSL